MFRLVTLLSCINLALAANSCSQPITPYIVGAIMVTMAVFLMLLALYLAFRRNWKTGAVPIEGRKLHGYDNVDLDSDSIQRDAPDKDLTDTATQTEDVVILDAKDIKEITSDDGEKTNDVADEVDGKTLAEEVTAMPSVEDLVAKIEEEGVQQAPAPLVLKRTKSRNEIRFRSGWRKTVKLNDLIDANIITESRVIELEEEKVTEEEIERELLPYLIGKYPIAGIYNDQTGIKMSLYAAYKEGIISRGTALSLLEAQAATGSIIDPITDEKMSIEDALKLNLLDRAFAAVLTRAERAVHGYKPKGSDETISLFQAMKRGLIVENHGIRLLEAQIATGGIIDPVANHRLPVEVAFERGLFDERLHETLDDPSDDTKGFLDPNTNENLTYLELLQRCVEDPDTKLLLLPLVKAEEVALYKNKQIRRESLRKRITSSGSTLSRTTSSGSDYDFS